MRDLPPDCTALGVPARPVETGRGVPDYPAAAKLYDLLATLLASGDIEELSPGRYHDKATGTIFDLTFIQPDGSETAAPEIRITPDP
jgi:hypothetical protein